MNAPVVTILTALAIAPSTSAGDEDLLPAGTINAAFGPPQRVYLVEDEPDLAAYVGGIRDQFTPGAPVLVGEASDGEHAGSGLIVYGTVEGLPWLEDLADSLPFRFDEEGLLLQGERFRGERLRLVCALRHPSNPDRRMVLYTAREPRHLLRVNDVFHGPTEWIVSDGGRTLATGSFRLTAPLSEEAARRDLAWLEDKIAAVHPAAVEGLPPDVAQRAERAEATFDGPVDRAEHWRELNAVLSELHDAHSRFAPVSLGSSATTFDLPLVWLREGLVAEYDAGPLRRGDLVERIGGRDEAELLALLADRVPAETEWWLRAQGPGLLATGFLTDALERAESGALPVRVERGGERVELELEPAAPVPRAPSLGGARPWVSWSIESDTGLAILTLDSCVFDDPYRRTLREFFEAVHAAKAPRVVVDVRRNTGGNSLVLDEFLRYLALDEYVGYTGAVRESPDSKAQRGGDRALGYHEYGRTVKRNTHVSGMLPFEGELTVLTGNATFSGGNWFAVVVRDNDLGEVVGEPTGNAPSSFGDILQFSLPESGYAFTLSYKRWIRPAPERDPARCLEPDVLVARTRADVVAGRDPVLDWLRERARRAIEPR